MGEEGESTLHGHSDSHTQKIKNINGQRKEDHSKATSGTHPCKENVNGFDEAGNLEAVNGIPEPGIVEAVNTLDEAGIVEAVKGFFEAGMGEAVIGFDEAEIVADDDHSFNGEQT
ncbi:hypothetical protein L2E82_04486 [Cichorium intybus]|uniref:Uncharacterized protein n=1 Tax=Cichorium intybus TaxID=13427 RepID=A0ACB9H7R6_CICIN|nr:hypothetical protein L2E82_04486 [Cichorium intybus]